VVALGFVGVLAVSGALVRQLDTDFLPPLEEGEFEIKYTLAPGLSLAASDRIATEMERAVLADPAVAHEGRLTGVDTNGYVPTGQNAGTIRVALKADAADPFDTVSDRLREALHKVAADAELEFHQLLEDQINDLSGAPEPLQVAIIGPDQAVLVGIAEGLAEQLGKIPGVVDVNAGVVEGNQTIRLQPKATGPVAAQDLRDELGASLGGIVATQLRDGGATIPVRVMLAADPKAAPLAEREVATSQGALKLDQVARIGEPTRTTTIFERNGTRMLLLTGHFEDVTLSQVIPAVRAVLIKAERAVPPGYLVKMGGAYEAQVLSFREFATVFEVAVPLVFIVLVAAFNSFRMPLVILASIPLCPLGIGLGLWLTDTSINVSSIMGLLLLVGVVVRNGILLVDSADRRRRDGAAVAAAVTGAGAERLRPILMTTLAAIGALLPLAVGFGRDAAMLRPLAIAVIGGLTTSTALTLVLIPALYASVLPGWRRPADGMGIGG
jgi:multidrug efflux pump subunit AcrB